MAKITPKFVKSCTFESARLDRTKAKIVVMPRPGAQEKPYQCQNRMGYFEAACTLFHHELPQIEHTKCIFKGDECCEYGSTWKGAQVRNVEKDPEPWEGHSFLPRWGPCFSGTLRPVLSPRPSLSPRLFVFSSFTWSLERKELQDGIDNLSLSTEEVVKKMETSIKNMDFARQVIVALSLESNREEMMRQITSLFEKELDYDRGMIFLANKEKTRLLNSTAASVIRKSTCRS